MGVLTRVISRKAGCGLYPGKSNALESQSMNEPDDLPSLDDVYRKFGEAAEAAQLLETALGTELFLTNATKEGLFETPDGARARNILGKINRHTLGQLVKNLNSKTHTLNQMEALLTRALEERNRLYHHFYRQHNFRRNSGDGRAIMISDLEVIHDTLLEAFKSVTLLLDGVDLEAEARDGHIVLPTGHVPI